MLPATAGAQAGGIAGNWVFYMEGDSTPQRVSLSVDRDTVRGRVYGSEFAGRLDEGRLTFRVGRYAWSSVVTDTRMDGWIVSGTDSSRWEGVKYVPPAMPRAFEHAPADYHRLLSAQPEPALRIYPGDTVRTTTVDAAGWSTGGYRERGNRVTEGGNPLTGPFYVEGTLPGDILVVHLHRVRLNRDWAYSGDALMSNVLDAAYLGAREVEGNLVQWELDPAEGVARLQAPTPALARFAVPLSPFLGAVGVAPGDGEALSTRRAGSFGGNMEYVGVREGATLYLPVGEEGAYLYLGDGHAAQGDGELTGDALETSMDVTFSVEVQPYRFRQVPRVETDEAIASIGIAGSLDQAIRTATSDMARWLEAGYGLTSTEAALVLGSAASYTIPDIVPPGVSVAIRVEKAVMAGVGE